MKTVVCLFLVAATVISESSCRLTAKSTRIFGRITTPQQQPVAGVKIIITATQHGLPPKGYILATPVTNGQGVYDTTVTVDKPYFQVELLYQMSDDSLRAGKYRHYDCYCNGQLVAGNYAIPNVPIGETSECNYLLRP